jgi:uncharacterized membrane protein YphA (DoxX/SURF4 family)
MDRRSRRLRRSLGLLALPALAGVASAHVDYVAPGGGAEAPVPFLVAAFTDPLVLAVVGGGAVAAVSGLFVALRRRPLAADVAALRAALSGYDDLLPWLLRLSVGLPLVGAGFRGYLFSPGVAPAAPTAVRLFGVGVGFFLLFGLATRFVAAVGLAGYAVALAVDPAALLASEFVAGLLAVALVGGGRPSADDVLARLAADERTAYSRVDPVYRSVVVPFAERIEPHDRWLPTVVRVGLGLNFAYLGVVQKLLSPASALAVVEQYGLTAVVPVSPTLWVVGAGVVEFAVGVALLAGLFTRLFAGVALSLFVTTLFALPNDPVLAHVSLFGLASVLMVTGGGPLSVDRWLHESGAAERVARGNAPGTAGD